MPSNYTGLPVVRALAGQEGPEVVISRNGDVNKPKQFFHPFNSSEGLKSAFCVLLGFLGFEPQKNTLSEGHCGLLL